MSSVKWVNKRLPSGIPFLNAFVMAVSGVNLLYLQLHFDIFFNSCCLPNPTPILKLTLAAIFFFFFLNVCVDLETLKHEKLIFAVHAYTDSRSYYPQNKKVK